MSNNSETKSDTTQMIENMIDVVGTETSDNRFFVSSYTDFYSRIHRDSEAVRQSTIEQYAKKAKSLIEASIRNGLLASDEKSPSAIADSIYRLVKMRAEAGDIGDSTLRFYRSAILTFVAAEARSLLELNDNHVEIERLASVYELTQQLKGNSNKKGKLTSANKKKGIPESIYLALTNRAFIRTGSQRKIALRAIVFLKSTELLGLRPSEWSQARLFSFIDRSRRKNGLTGITIDNAKATQGRACGESRTLELTGLKPDELELIAKQISFTREAIERSGLSPEKSLRYYLHKIQTTIRAAAKHHFETTGDDSCLGVSLYSARHEAIAKLKSSNLTEVEVAAAVGHTSIRTHKRQYARGKSGKAVRVKFRPTKETVSKVGQHLDRKYNTLDIDLNNLFAEPD